MFLGPFQWTVKTSVISLPIRTLILITAPVRVSLTTNGNVSGLKVEHAVRIRSLNKHMTRPSLNNELYHALQTL